MAVYVEERLQVRPNSLIVYGQLHGASHRRHDLHSPTISTYSGRVTNHTKKRISAALDNMIQKSVARFATAAAIDPAAAAAAAESDDPAQQPKMFMNFVTLTIASQKNLQVKESYDLLLAPWLRYSKNKMGMSDYVWKAEYQQRGQVHYHVATNVYMDWKTVRWKWNQLQRQNRLLDDFALRHGHFNPNSTDVHPVRSITAAAEYMAKEMCKDVQNAKTTKGKVWDCSKNLKIGRFNCGLTSENKDLIMEAIQMGEAEIIESDHCSIIKMRQPERVLDQLQLSQYKQHFS